MRSAALARQPIGVKLVNYANGARPFINSIFMAPLPEENPTHLVALLRVRFLRIDDAQAFGDGGAARAFQLEEEGDGNGGLPDEEGREGRPGGCGSLGSDHYIPRGGCNDHQQAAGGGGGHAAAARQRHGGGAADERSD